MSNTVLADWDSTKTIQRAQNFKVKDNGRYATWGICVLADVPGNGRIQHLFLEFKNSKRCSFSET